MNNDMNWKNPCPDASVPMSPSGAFGTYTTGGAFTPGPGSLVSGPPLHELTGAQRPNISYTIHTTTPRWNAIPKTAAQAPEIDPFIDEIRRSYLELKETQVSAHFMITEQKQEIDMLTVQVNWYKRLLQEAEDKLAKIKAHL